MVLVELIGSLSLAIALVSAVALAIIHIRNRQNNITYIHDRPVNSIEQSEIITTHIQEEINQLSSVLPFDEFNRNISITSTPSKTSINKELSIINVINNDEILSSPIKYGIQWSLPSNDDEQTKTINSPSTILKSSEFDQGDSLSLSDQTISVKNLIEKFENDSIYSTRKTYHRTLYNNEKEKNHTDSDLTSIDTTFDSETIKIGLNQNQKKPSHHSSISNLDITIPSNLSSSIDLEQFECFSTTSNLSEFLNNN